MDSSIFSDKNETPDDFLLSGALGDTFDLWMEIREYVLKVYPNSEEIWSYSGEKYGWSFRIKDKKRVIAYLLPRDRFFLVALVFGGKATAEALKSGISQDLKIIIESAKVYAEGRGFRIEVKDKTLIPDIKKLVQIKISG